MRLCRVKDVSDEWGCGYEITGYVNCCHLLLYWHSLVSSSVTLSPLSSTVPPILFHSPHLSSLSLSLSLSLSVCLSVSSPDLSTSQHFCQLSVCVSISLPVCLSVCLSLYLSPPLSPPLSP